MKIPTVKLVFDRKKVATKKKKGLVQMQILYERKRKWSATGVYLYKGQWDDIKWVVNRTDMFELNEFLRKQVERVEKWIRDDASEGNAFSWEALGRFLERSGEDDSLLAFFEKEIDGRNDIRESTKKSHRKLITILREYGKIKTFQDLTRAAVMDFDNWLHGRKVRRLDKDGREKFTPIRQSSLYDFHKMLKSYTNRAIDKGLIKSNPYTGLHFKRGESEPDRYLTEDELKSMETAEMRNGRVTRARDLFLFQCYTGLSYADLREFDFSKVRDAKGSLLYSGKRVKTGEPFHFVLPKRAVAILKKYRYRLPIVSNVSYNAGLKKVAEDCGISKPLASHWARRTAAMVFANHGVRIEVVAKILGHSNTITTQKFYASITGDTVAEEMKKAGLL